MQVRALRTVASRRLFPATLLAVAAVVLIAVMRLVAHHTIEVVRAEQLLPRWDLATHLGHGWTDYHLLVTGQVPRLLGDLWLQGYWPPVLSIVQIPFYLLLDGSMTSGLWVSPAAFVLTGIVGCALLWRERPRVGALAASLFVALLISSPYLLAYASVTMTEMLGACVQVIVLFSYLRYREGPTFATARAFAIALTVLFFTKYNYFLMLAVPLVVYEWLEHTRGLPIARRASAVWRGACRVLSSPVGMFLVVYIVAVLLVVRTGGFELHLLGRRISVRSVGNSALIVLYVLLAWIWSRHRRGQIDWVRLMAADVRVRPLLLWFAVPVTIWLASPYPNHTRDFANLVINQPMGEASLRAGIAVYLEALRASYFYSGWVFALVASAFVAGVIAYRRQPAVTQLLIVAAPLQFVFIVLHHTRFPRFLLLAVVLLCLAASSEVGRWLAGSRSSRVAATVLAPIVLAAGVLGATAVVGQERFRGIAFEHYTDSTALREAFGSIRNQLSADDRLAVVGQSDELSPALFRWQLGPPSGVPCLPFETVGSQKIELSQATKVLLLVPVGPGEGRLEALHLYVPHRAGLEKRAGDGEFQLERKIPVPDLQVAFRLYARTSPPERKPPCR